MMKWKDTQNTYKRFNKVLKCPEFLAYGGERGTMNDEPSYFRRDRRVSALFEG